VSQKGGIEQRKLLGGYLEGSGCGRDVGGGDVNLYLPAAAHGELYAGLIGATWHEVGIEAISAHIHGFHGTFQGYVRVDYWLLRVTHQYLHREGCGLGDGGRIGADLQGHLVRASLSGLHLGGSAAGNYSRDNGTKPGHEDEKSNAEGNYKQVPSHSHS
jgi:hypothetical protein